MHLYILNISGKDEMQFLTKKSTHGQEVYEIQRLGGFNLLIEMMLETRGYYRDDDLLLEDLSFHLFTDGADAILMKSYFYESGELHDAIMCATDDAACDVVLEIGLYLRQASSYLVKGIFLQCSL